MVGLHRTSTAGAESGHDGRPAGAMMAGCRGSRRSARSTQFLLPLTVSSGSASPSDHSNVSWRGTCRRRPTHSERRPGDQARLGRSLDRSGDGIWVRSRRGRHLVRRRLLGSVLRARDLGLARRPRPAEALLALEARPGHGAAAVCLPCYPVRDERRPVSWGTVRVSGQSRELPRLVRDRPDVLRAGRLCGRGSLLAPAGRRFVPPPDGGCFRRARKGKWSLVSRVGPFGDGRGDPLRAFHCLIPRGRAHRHPRASALPSRGLRCCRRDGLPRCSRGDPRDESDPPGRSAPSSTGRDPPCGRRVLGTYRLRLEGCPSARGPGSRGGRRTPWRGLRLLRVGLSGHGERRRPKMRTPLALVMDSGTRRPSRPRGTGAYCAGARNAA